MRSRVIILFYQLLFVGLENPWIGAVFDSLFALQSVSIWKLCLNVFHFLVKFFIN